MQVTFGNIIQRNNVLPVHPRKKEDKKSDLIVDMNRATLYDVKYRGLFDYPDATSEDYARLTSITVEDSYKRATYVQPTSGKVFHLLEEERSEDKVKLKVLDERGKFQKFIEVEPKHVVVVDSFFKNKKNNFFKGEEDIILSHGEIVATYLLRTNPWVNYEYIGVDGTDEFLDIKVATREFKKILRDIERGKKVDLINCSFGVPINKNIRHGDDIFEIRANMSQTEEELLEEYIKMNMYQLHQNMAVIKKLKENGVQIFGASGNNGEGSYNTHTLLSEVDGVGALNTDGKIAVYSSSRDKKHTSHYELGDYEMGSTPEGINITGLKGTDIKCLEVGKMLNLTDEDIISKEEFEKMFNEFQEMGLQDENNPKFKKKLSEYSGKLIHMEDYFKLTGEDELPETYKNVGAEKKFYYIKEDGGKISAVKLKSGKIIPFAWCYALRGTSYSTPIRAGKVLLNEMLEGKI